MHNNIIIILHFHYISMLAHLSTFCMHVYIAAETKNNESLKIYHSGAYGSLQPDEWSCCKRKGQKQMGCIIPDSMEERLRERRLSPPQPIPRSRGGVY